MEALVNLFIQPTFLSDSLPGAVGGTGREDSALIIKVQAQLRCLQSTGKPPRGRV